MFMALVLFALAFATLAVIGAAVSALPSKLLDHRSTLFDRAGEPAIGPMPVFDGAGGTSLLLGTGEPTEAPNQSAAAKPGIETYFEKGEWKNKVQGSSRAANKHTTKTAAVKAGRDMAMKRRVEHIVKNKDGTIGQKTSYGNDPRSVPG